MEVTLLGRSGQRVLEVAVQALRHDIELAPTPSRQKPVKTAQFWDKLFSRRRVSSRTVKVRILKNR